MIITCDFTKDGHNIHKYKELDDHMKNLDIAIIVNNAGVNYRSYIRDTSLEDILEMVIVNTYPYTFLTHTLISKIKQRHQKSAIITISSNITVSPTAFDAIYACTKIFELF